MDIEWVWSNTIDRMQGEENVPTNGSKLLPVPPPRRYSAGKPKLPWERERKEQSLSAPTKKDVSSDFTQSLLFIEFICYTSVQGSYQLNFVQRQNDRHSKAPPPTYANWLAEPNAGKNLSISDRFYPRTMDSSDSPTSRPRFGYADQFLTAKKKLSDPIPRNYPREREADFNNEDSYSSELDLSQSWPAQLFERSVPITNAESGPLCG